MDTLIKLLFCTVSTPQATCPTSQQRDLAQRDIIATLMTSHSQGIASLIFIEALETGQKLRT